MRHLYKAGTVLTANKDIEDVWGDIILQKGDKYELLNDVFSNHNQVNIVSYYDNEVYEIYITDLPKDKIKKKLILLLKNK